MREFEDLSRQGKAMRLNRLARDVSTLDYGLSDPRVRIIAHSFNTVARVDLPGQSLALRIGDRHRIHGDGVEDVEAEWLAALHDQGFVVPRNVPTTSGRTWVEREGRGVPVPRRCVMYTWVRGRALPDLVDDFWMSRAGALMAKLHEQAAGFKPTTIPPAVRADSVVYFGEHNQLPGYKSTHGSLLVEALDRAQDLIDGLWKSPPHRPQLIHGDFGPHNLLRLGGGLRPIDFQDLLYGFDIMDLAITVEYLRRKAPYAIEALRAGYESRRPWPDVSPVIFEGLCAARSLNLINLGLTLRRPGVEQFLGMHTNQVLSWMRRT
jgi:Ser/Thr protein kinase RdoA (MazF antagonist)